MHSIACGLAAIVPPNEFEAGAGLKTCEPEPVSVWPPNGKLVEIEIDVTAVDAVSGPGRTYTLTYESSDAFGNVATCDAEILVPHDQRHGAGYMTLAST